MSRASVFQVLNKLLKKKSSFNYTKCNSDFEFFLLNYILTILRENNFTLELTFEHQSFQFY